MPSTSSDDLGRNEHGAVPGKLGKSGCWPSSCDYAVRRYHRGSHRRVAASFASFGVGLRDHARRSTRSPSPTGSRSATPCRSARTRDSRRCGPCPAASPDGSGSVTRSRIEGYFSVAAAESVTIGNGVLIGSNVAIRDHDHGMAPDSRRGAGSRSWKAPVEIGDFVWLEPERGRVEGCHHRQERGRRRQRRRHASGARRERSSPACLRGRSLPPRPLA